jgi:hypothetical protein
VAYRGRDSRDDEDEVEDDEASGVRQRNGQTEVTLMPWWLLLTLKEDPLRQQ